MMCSELSGDVSREGLRNAMWKALQKQKNSIKDDRILTAVTVAEVCIKFSKQNRLLLVQTDYIIL